MGAALVHALLRPARTFSLLCCATALLVSGCDNTIEPTEQLPPLEPAALDEGAANWEMILLTGPTQFAVAAPEAVNSAAYQSELTSIRLAQSRLTDAQRHSIQYWSGGGVLRWNQFVRQLVARLSPRE